MNTSLAVLGLSGGELVLVVLAVLVLFGAKKIPDFAKGLGQGIKEFKKASREVTDEFQSAMNQESPTPLPPPPAPTKMHIPNGPDTVPSTPASTVPKA